MKINSFTFQSPRRLINALNLKCVLYELKIIIIMKSNSTLPLFLCDFYKLCHADQYDKRIRRLVSYMTPRGSRLPNKNYVVSFGAQAFCKEYLIDVFNNEFFSKDIESVLTKAKDFLENTLPGIDIDKTLERISSLHKLGYLPISIYTVPEGELVSIKCPTIELITTNENFAWVGGYIESLLSSYGWKMPLDATIGHWYREVANKYYELTVDNWENKVKSSMSEFGFRGADSPESGIHSGAAWLLSFDKTATCSSISFVNKYYNTIFHNDTYDATPCYNKFLQECTEKSLVMKGSTLVESFMRANEDFYLDAANLNPNNHPEYIIPKDIWEDNKRKIAINGRLVDIKWKLGRVVIPYNECIVGKGLISTEHSVMCSSTQIYMAEGLTQEDAEKKVVKDLLTKIYPESSFSMVSDSYDYWRMVTRIIPSLKDKILDRGSVDLTDKIMSKYEMMMAASDNSKISDTDLLRTARRIEFENAISRGLDPDKLYFKSGSLIYKFRYECESVGNYKTYKFIDIIDDDNYEIKTPTLFVRGDSGDPVKIVSGYLIIETKIDEDLDEKVEELYNSLDLGDIIDLDAFREYVVYPVKEGGVTKYYVSCDSLSEVPSYEVKGTVECLWDSFSGHKNSKGYNVLDPHIRVIYGDSITHIRQELIYKFLMHKGFSVENVALGAGSFSFHSYQDEYGKLYPYTRDTFQFAMKATYGELIEESIGSSSNGEGHPQLYRKMTPIMIYKDPKTDNEHFKKSMKGCCAIYTTEVDENGNYRYYLDHDGLTLNERLNDSNNKLMEIFNNGIMIHEDTFKDIRDRLNKGKF